MLRGIGHAKPGNPRQFIHAAFTLGEKFQQFQSVAVTQCLADTGELDKQVVLETAFVRCAA